MTRIPPEALDKICEPFWRHNSTGNREGLGLGLYICSQIVRAHGGTLSVTSSQERGTSFTARLPLDADHLHQDPARIAPISGPMMGTKA